ncbi:MAG TPA: acyltransferase, partial [Acidimicrobiales bacterium]|nr:acyltransferase [Acidimicrobiales bacterium]
MDGWSVRGRHLPALDGLRALAVAAVVAYHLSYGWARGGYLGVDLFFVLSGFLITSLLLEEREATGSIRLAAFWGRRARRLLPALVVMVAAVMVFLVAEGREGNSAFVAGFDLVSLRPQAFAALFYYSNWWLIHVQQSYFTQFSTPSPFQHTWSLAIEEQFYLAWPFITLALAAKGLAARRRAGITAATVIAVGSAVLMAVLFTPGGDPSRLYYGTDTRIQDLAVGTLLAWLTARRPETPPRLARALTVVAPAALCGLLALMAVAGTSSGPTAGEPTGYMFEGGFLVASVLSAIVIADVRREGSALRAIFSWRPLVAIGLVSYGIYLWHWPVIVLLTPATVAGATGAGLLAVRLAVLAAAVLVSYFAIELPVRRGRLPRPAQWTVYPAAACAVVAAVVIGTTPSFVIKSYVRATLLRYAPTTPPTGSGGVAGQVPIDLGRAVSRSDPLRVVLVGDSMLNLAGPGVVAALDATGEVRATNRSFDGWGTSPTA